MIPGEGERLRVAFVAGTLGMGGAEKQMVYMARALSEAGLDVQVYRLTEGEHYQAVLAQHGIPTVWIGQSANPIRRLAALVRELRKFRPHILESAHFFTNIYAGLAAPLVKCLSIGAIRSDTSREFKEHGLWSRSLLRLPDALIANSYAARQTAVQSGVAESKISVLYNVIDLDDFDRKASQEVDFTRRDDQVVAALVANLIPFKRVERFLDALAEARKQAPELIGMVVGDGRSLPELEERARQLGLLPGGVQFLGRRKDVPGLLAQADFLMLTSDHEGIPNVLLEAMAGSLPVITTPTGDAARIVKDGLSGYVVDFEDQAGRVERMLALARNRSLRKGMGTVGRRLVESEYSDEKLGASLLGLYGEIARARGGRRQRKEIELLAASAGGKSIRVAE